jgi:hypothetical protein
MVTSSSASHLGSFLGDETAFKTSLHYPSTVTEIQFSAAIKSLSGRSPGKVNNMAVSSSLE